MKRLKVLRFYKDRGFPRRARTRLPIYLVFLICIAAVPLVYAFTGAAIPFGNDRFCDTWYYFGLMAFPELGHILAPGARTISRLPAYVPVWALRQMGAPGTGQELYFWLNHIIFVVAMVVALTALFEITTALIVTVLLSTSALYLAVLSTTYPTGAALAYASVATACVAVGIRRPVFLYPLSFLGGIFVALSLHSHLVSAVFIFFLPILYLLIGVRSFLIGGSVMVAGILAGTGLVGLTGIYFDQGFWSFMNQIRAVITGIGDYWYKGWMLRSIGLLLMFFLPILQAITVKGRKHSSKRSQVILLAAIAVSIINLVVTFGHKDQNLVFNFMYVMAIPIVALVIADAIEDHVARVDAFICGTVLLSLIVLHVLIVAYLRRYILLHFMPIAVVGALVALLAALICIRSRSVVGGIAALGGLFLLVQSSLGDYYRDHLYLDRSLARSNTQNIDAALRFIRGYGITQKPIVWLGKVDDQAIETGAFQSLVRCGFSIDFPQKLPNSTLQWQPALAPGRLLIVMDNPEKYPSITNALVQKGITIERVKSEDIDRGLEITIGKIQTVAPSKGQ